MTAKAPSRPGERPLVDYDAVLADFAAATGIDLQGRARAIVPPKAGPNAVHKILIRPAGGEQGVVLAVADRPDTNVIRHEADILQRLRDKLPPALARTVPALLAHGRAGGVDYFAVAYCPGNPATGWKRRLTRQRRLKWGVDWLTELACNTRGANLAAAGIDAEFVDASSRLDADGAIATETKTRVRASLSLVRRRSAEIPSVCCHGDVWSGNFLWTGAWSRAVVVDWGAARWPGLPGADLARFLLEECRSDGRFADSLIRYGAALGLDVGLVPALYDLHLLFIKAELDHAYASCDDRPADPFGAQAEARTARLAHLMRSLMRDVPARD